MTKNLDTKNTTDKTLCIGCQKEILESEERYLDDKRGPYHTDCLPDEGSDEPPDIYEEFKLHDLPEAVTEKRVRAIAIRLEFDFTFERDFKVHRRLDGMFLKGNVLKVMERYADFRQTVMRERSASEKMREDCLKVVEAVRKFIDQPEYQQQKYRLEEVPAGFKLLRDIHQEAMFRWQGRHSVIRFSLLNSMLKDAGIRAVLNTNDLI